MQQGGVLEARASTEAVPDRELLRAVRAGDIDVFDVLWNRYHGQLLGYAVKRLPIQQAEDAISIVMEGTLRALIAGKGPEQFFRAYVFQSLRREIGRQRADAELNQPAEHEQLDLVAPVRHEPQRLEVGMLVKDILGSFSQSDRLLLTLNLEEGRRIADIATSLGLAPESASQRLYRAKSEFKSRWFAAHLDLSDAPELCRTTLADAPYAMGRRHKPGRAKKFWSHVDSCDFCRPRVQEAEGAADRLVVLFPAAFAAFAWAEPGALVVQALQATGRSLNPSGMAGIANSVSAVPIGAKVGAGAAVVAMGVGVSLLMSGVLAPAHQADNLTAKVPSQDRATSLTAPATPPQTSASRLQPPATKSGNNLVLNLPVNNINTPMVVQYYRGALLGWVTAETRPATGNANAAPASITLRTTSMLAVTGDTDMRIVLTTGTPGAEDVALTFVVNRVVLFGPLTMVSGDG